MVNQCDYCAHFWIDEEDGQGECMVNLDEDDREFDTFFLTTYSTPLLNKPY